MAETPFYFPNSNGDKLFGVLHNPDGPVRKGLIFCHPYAEEKLWTHRVYVNFAREMALSGYASLRFDYKGHGDSEGKFEDSSVKSRLSDIESAIIWLKNEMPDILDICLCGLRFGATLALLAAENNPDIQKVVLWEPIVNGEKYLQEVLRSNLATQNAVYKEIRYTRKQLVESLSKGETINYEGYEISYPFYTEASGIDLLSQDYRSGIRKLVVQIARVKKDISKDHKKLLEKMPNVDHRSVVEEPFWKEIKKYYPKADNLYETTKNWLIEDE